MADLVRDFRGWSQIDDVQLPDHCQIFPNPFKAGFDHQIAVRAGFDKGAVITCQTDLALQYPAIFPLRIGYPPGTLPAAPFTDILPAISGFIGIARFATRTATDDPVGCWCKILGWGGFSVDAAHRHQIIPATTNARVPSC